MVLGPFVISLPRLFFLSGLVVAWLVSLGVDRRTGRPVEKTLWVCLIAGLVIARLGFVAAHWSAFAAQPLDILKFWQGGYMPVPGVIIALIVAALACLPRFGHAPRLLFAPLLVGIVVWGGLGWTHHALEKGMAHPLPDIALTRLDGTTASPVDFRGRPVVVNLWATWCPPCRREMPVLAQAQDRHRHIRFLFVNQGEGPDTIQAYLDEADLHLQHVLMDAHGQFAADFGVRGLPATLFFDANGQLIDSHMGALGRGLLDDYLRKLQP